MRISGLFTKLGIIILMIVLPFKNNLNWYRLKEADQLKTQGPIKPGVYEVRTFILNNDTVALSNNLRWKDVIFDNNTDGSIGTTDTMFRQRYGRGYFKFSIDSTKQNLDIIKRTIDFKTVKLGKIHFNLPDSNTVILNGMLRKDSVYVVLFRTNRHFQLSKKQFHWITNSPP